MVDQMEKLYEILSQQSIKLSLAVYPWPHQLEKRRNKFETRKNMAGILQKINAKI